VDPDGIEFNRSAIEVSRIKEDADYEGVRVQFHATLARARIPMQLDIGFGDVITPAPTEIEYPTLLNFPAPVLRAYPKETVIAEKLEALTALGLLNSRMKDFYDLALLSRMYQFLRESGWPRQSSRPSVIGEQRLRPNRSGLPKRTPMTPHELSNGARSCAAAGSVKARMIWHGSSPKSDRLLCLCFQPRRPDTHSRFFGSQADRGNERLPGCEGEPDGLTLSIFLLL